MISTVHKERGNCTIDSLLQILERIQPEVIFCETSPATFDLIAKKLIQPSLEIKSINSFSKHHSFSFVAVDSHPLPNVEFKNQVIKMFDSIEQNKEYLAISKKHKDNTQRLGFKYLNSKECIKVFTKMKRMENNAINEMRNQEYKNAYQSWLSINEKREDEMIENICSYIGKNEFKTAVFLCGSAHRKSIIEKIEKKNSEINIRKTWSFKLPE